MKIFQQTKDYIQKRITISEISGSLGDMGTLLPIVVSLSKKKVININSAIFFGGLFNIIVGVCFDTPLPVQPMKTVSSAAIAGNLNSKSLMTSGFLASVIILFLGITNLVTFVMKFIPGYLIASLQMGQGLNFIIQGVKMIQGLNNWTDKNSYITTIVFGSMILITWLPWKNNYKNKYLNIFSKIIQSLPVALILFLIGAIYSITDLKKSYKFTITNPFIDAYKDLTFDDFKEGFLKGTIAQVPLTLLNSVISVVDLNNRLFPERPTSVNYMAYSVGLMNIVGVWFGSMPNCHGSGGLAGQYRFGARSGLAIIMLGICKILISIFLGNVILDIISVFPNSILGLMIIVCGGELAGRGSDVKIEEPLIYAIVVGIIVTTDLYTGFIVGFVINVILMSMDKFNNKFQLPLLENENPNENQSQSQLETRRNVIEACC